MSASLNKVMLIGHLGTEVKMFNFENGDSIANFSIATTESYTPKGKSEKVETTEWHRIVARNRLAKVCEQYIGKGDLVFVEGRIHTNKWEDGGVMKYSTEIIAISVEFLKTKNKVKEEMTEEEGAF